MYLPHTKYAITGLRRSSGETHNPPWNLLYNLGESSRIIGNYTEAEAIDRQALQISETVLRKEHRDTLKSMNNLATSLRLQGKYTESEAMHWQTLQLRETVLGKKHPDTLDSMNNLAGSLY